MKDLFEGNNSPTMQNWRDQVAKDLKGADFNEKLLTTIDGIAVQPLYTRENLPIFETDASADYLEDLDTDFMEAVAEQGQQTLSWNVSEEMLVTENSDLETMVVDARKRGANHIRVKVSDEGVWDLVVNQIVKLSKPVNFSFDINTDLLDEDIVAKWRDRVGYLGERDRLLYGIEFDPKAFWLHYGEPESKGLAYTHLADLFFRLSGHLHDCKIIKIDTSYLADKGEDVITQLTETLLIAAEYFEQMERRDVDLTELMHVVTFRFGVGTNFFFEIAKLRAFKILWNNFIKAYMPEMDFIPHPEIQCVTSTASFTQTDEHSNLLRTTTAAMSAILGGCDALCVLPFSKTNNDVDAQQLATNIQNILRYESYMDKYREAANGSFYIETLTKEFGEKAWQQFIESKK